MSTEHGHEHGHGRGPGYETRDAWVTGLLMFGGGMVIALVVIQLLMLGFYTTFEDEGPAEIQVKTQTNIYQQLRDLHNTEKAGLEHYGWIDQPKGIVRIPIDRAIELVAEKGVRFGKGPKTEIEMNSHAGTPVPAPAPKDAEKAGKPPEPRESKP
jgi:hypothetical protein